MKNKHKHFKDITHDRLLEVLDYNKHTGVFIWKVDIAHRSKFDTVAGSKNKDGYISISIDNTRYRAHRIAWFYVYKKWPENYIDHINGNRSDNRICNLRDVTRRENAQNREEHRLGKLVGTRFHKQTGRWQASIVIHGKKNSLGYFETELEAHSAYMSKVIETKD